MRSSRGFTLIETLVVVTILAIVVGVLISRGPTKSATIDLTAASRTLADDLRHARAQAIDTDRPVRLDAAQMRVALARLVDRRAGPISLSVHSPADAARRDGVLRFNPDGSANGARIVLVEGHEHIDIAIDWLTGRIDRGTIARDPDAS
ncbi:GspH/FimT family pseudopilin [Lichenicoccus sp.]|uniref:GspH/FimT family pseudopilin n=1 Tax=Lichenicoccus sp. TaxID=2781899 RepID=UPI003D0F1F6C